MKDKKKRTMPEGFFMVKYGEGGRLIKGCFYHKAKRWGVPVILTVIGVSGTLGAAWVTANAVKDAASVIVSVRKGQTDGYKYALVIGNGNYPPDIGGKFPSFVQNAKDVTNALERLDWKVCCLTDSSLNEVISVKKTFTEPRKGITHIFRFGLLRRESRYDRHRHFFMHGLSLRLKTNSQSMIY